MSTRRYLRPHARTADAHTEEHCSISKKDRMEGLAEHAVSLDEGLGLPLIEAAKHAQPILARDLPVFREIAGDHATYFSGTAPRDLADAPRRWMRDRTAGKVRGTAEMPWLTWEQSARQFTEVVFGDRWDATYHADRKGSARRQPFAGAKPDIPADAAEAARAAEPIAAGSD